MCTKQKQWAFILCIITHSTAVLLSLTEWSKPHVYQCTCTIFISGCIHYDPKTTNPILKSNKQQYMQTQRLNQTDFYIKSYSIQEPVIWLLFLEKSPARLLNCHQHIILALFSGTPHEVIRRMESGRGDGDRKVWRIWDKGCLHSLITITLMPNCPQNLCVCVCVCVCV